MDATNSVSITGGGYAAQISLLGGQLLSLTHHEDELVVPAAKTEGAFAGAVLAPWPNRTKGGRYTFNGVEHLLPVNEEATGAALHGLLIDLPLDVISQKDSEVQLTGWLESSEGYPFGLDIALTYRVSADLGLAATLMARYRPEELAEEVDPQAEAPLTASEDAGQPALGIDAEDPEAPEVLEGESHETADADTEADDRMDVDATGDAFDVDGDVLKRDAVERDAVDNDADMVKGDADADAVDADADDDGDAADSDTDPSDLPDGEADQDEVLEPAGAASSAAPQTAPFGAGFHPYLTAGGAPLKECRLRLPARTMLKTKADGTVTGRKAVSQDFDLTNGPLLAGRTIDHAFTDLPEEGWTAELTHGPSGFVVRMIADSPWVQVYTGERIDRAGIAVEPMSCPPNALNSGEDLIQLVPGKWFRMGYSIEAIRAD